MNLDGLIYDLEADVLGVSVLAPDYGKKRDGTSTDPDRVRADKEEARVQVCRILIDYGYSETRVDSLSVDELYMFCIGVVSTMILKYKEEI